MVRLEMCLVVSENKANKKPEKRLRERPVIMGKFRSAPKTRLDMTIPGILLTLLRVTKAVPVISFWEENADREIITDTRAEPYIHVSAENTAAHCVTRSELTAFRG